MAISKKRSTIRYPLDLILGSEAHVRILRVLIHEVDTPLGVSNVARLAGLTSAGARKALERLLESGLIERIGQGRTVQYGLREREPVVLALRLLFEREHERYDSLVSSIQNAISDLREVRKAWIERPPTNARGPIEINVVTEVNAIEWIGEELRSRLAGLEKEFDLIIEVALFTRADAPLPGPDTVLLCSMEGDQKPGIRHPALTHAQAEKRSLLFAQGIAELIQSDPSLITRAKHHLNRLIHDDQGNAVGDIAEWRQLLETYSINRIRELLVSRNSRADRLRQSSPFLAVLTADELERLITLVDNQR